MMNNQVGQVYINEEGRKCRIISSDHIEVFYEDWFDGEWYLTRTRSAIFGRLPVDYFFKHFKLLNEATDDLSTELTRFYPFIPLRMLRYSNIFWTSTPFSSIPEMNEFLCLQGINLKDEPHINVNEIYIDPISPLGRSYNGPKLISKNSEGFMPEEILFHAFQVQSKMVKQGQTSIQYERYGPIYNGIGL